MVQLRRWVLSSSPRVSLFGTLLLASAAGCQSTRDYAATAVSTIRCWKTPVVETSEPQTSTLVDAKPRPVVPYEETPAILPRPRALLDNDSPTPAPPAELINETPRRSGKLRAETVTVDDVAPAPLPSVDASTVDTADSSTSTADQAAGNAVPVEEKRSDSSTENETGTPPRTAVEPLFDRPIPVPPALPQPVVSPDELPSNATESSIPGLPVEIRPANVQPQATESETSVTPNIEDASRSDSARVQPLFPDTQSVVTVASKVSPDSQPTNERVRPQQRVITSVTLPDPMPTVPATSAREETTLPSVTADQPSREVAIIARLDSEAVCIGFDQNGNLLVASDESLSRISPTGTLQEFAEVDSPRGFASLPGGAFAVCDAHQRSLLRIDSTGRNIDVLAQRSDGHFLKVPSFVAIDASGGVYFTDPGYARISTPAGRLHYVSADGDINLVSQHLAYPQGVALSGDETQLFLVESQSNRVIRFDVLSPGRVGPAHSFSRLLPKNSTDTDDFATGLTIDSDGRLFVARHGMQRIDVINANGEFARSIAVPGVLASSLVLSQDQSDLFVAGAVADAQWSGIVVRVPKSSRN